MAPNCARGYQDREIPYKFDSNGKVSDERGFRFCTEAERWRRTAHADIRIGKSLINLTPMERCPTREVFGFVRRPNDGAELRTWILGSGNPL